MRDAEPTEIRCAMCDAELMATTDVAACPYCGSRNRRIVTQERLQLHEFIRIKSAAPGASGRPALEFASGDDLTKSTQEWVAKERRIDRENDRYYERVVDKHGNTIREVDDPLSEHRGRGAAKRRPAAGASSS